MPTLTNILKSVREKRYNQDFEQVKKIGRGGYASVYKCKNVLDDQYYAVKKIKLRINDLKNNMEDEIERVLREVKVLAKVNHPNILRYYNSWLEVQHKTEEEMERSTNRNQRLDSNPFQEPEMKFARELDDVEESPEDDSVVFSHEDVEESPGNKSMLIDSGVKQKSNCYDEYDHNNSGFVRNGIFLKFKGKDEEEEAYDFRKTHKKGERRSPVEPLIMQHIKQKSKIQERFDEVAKRINGHASEEFRLLSDSPPHETRKKNKQFAIKTHALFDSKSTPMKDDSPTREFNSPPLTKKKIHQLLKKDLTIEVKEVKSTFFESIKSITLYIQTELCKNTLEDYITDRNAEFDAKRNSPGFNIIKERKIKEAVNIALQIVKGLDYIHSVVRIVHRDLKPGNILITDDNIVKIGDFGVVKKMKFFSPLEPSPMISGLASPEREDSPLIRGIHKNFLLDPKDEEKNCEFELKIGNDDQLSCDEEGSFDGKSHESLDSPTIISKNEITKEVGTKTFASPEQLAADAKIFDERSDIWSLGIIFLLLFYPMVTAMEQTHTISQCKKGILPERFEKDHPNLASLVKRMLSKNPTHRPLLKEIESELKKKPEELSTRYTGAVRIRSEGSKLWKDKWLTIANEKLYIYQNQGDRKAKKILNLNGWRIDFQNREDKENIDSNYEDSKAIEERNSDSKPRNGPTKFIILESESQQGCFIAAASDDYSTIEKIYNQLKTAKEINIY